jgi:hypothetical protein
MFSPENLIVNLGVVLRTFAKIKLPPAGDGVVQL